jgi:hypothetical protein
MRLREGVQLQIDSTRAFFVGKGSIPHVNIFMLNFCFCFEAGKTRCPFRPQDPVEDEVQCGRYDASLL